MRQKAIVWFRNDLRINDNEALSSTAELYDVYPVYIFDERHYLEVPVLGFRKTGSFKTQFLIESVAELKRSLQTLGSDLIVRVGKPEEILLELLDEIKAVKLVASKEVAAEELTLEKALEERFFKKSIDFELYWQHTLFHEEDVPWPIKQVPEVFTKFRKESEKTVQVRALFKPPKKLNEVDISCGEIPSLGDLTLEEISYDKRSVIKFKGGEKAALERLDNYFWDKDLLKTYKSTRNGLIGADYSSKLSPWLAVGAISAKTIYCQIKKYEEDRVKNQSTYWLFFELLWRDFFRFMAKKHGSKIFQKNGFSSLVSDQQNDHQKFELWCNGNTEEPFIDANMKELANTDRKSVV